MKKIRLGLVGKDVSASTSDRIHTFILKQFGYDCDYEKISVSSEEFDLAMRRLLGDFDGFNVTIPYKRDVMEYLDGVQGDAFAYGAVNTVVAKTRLGHNTDGAGFLLMLQTAGFAVAGKRILVLGGGGSGRSSAVALKNAGARVYMYQRRQDKLEETCKELGITPAEHVELGGYDLVVNATGVGMHDTVGDSPVTATAFLSAEGAIDLIYEPAETEFLRLARAQGIPTCNGKSMLFYQAYFADCLYLGRTPDAEQAKAFYQIYKTTEASK